MALDESLYDSLKETFFALENYLNNTQLTREHSELIMKNEELSALLERLDIEAIEEQTKEIELLHEKLHDLKNISDGIRDTLVSGNENGAMLLDIVKSLNAIFGKINTLIV